MSAENIKKFTDSLTQSLQENTFVKMTLGNYKGDDPQLQKLLIRLIKTKKGVRLFFLYRYETRDTVKNFSFEDGIALIEQLLSKDFFAGHLFTTVNNFQLDIGKKGRSRLNVAKPTFKSVPNLDHNKEKTRVIDQNTFYLKALGITTETGEIKTKQHNKWKQINKFIETLEILIRNSGLNNRTALKIVDMGCGKGYLTFAAYDFFKNEKNLDINITGVDTKSNLIELCNGIAESSGFEGLKFEYGKIDDYEIGEADVLIALHACNTATDDAIFKGIQTKASLIVAAPCCHQEVRPQLKPPEMLANVLKHGTLLENEAETLTDGLRSLLLEANGYEAKIFEFVSSDHTPKNNLIVGTRTETDQNTSEILSQIAKIKEFYGIETQKLETLLSQS